MKIKDIILSLAIITFMSLVSNVLATKATILESIPGLIILDVLVIISILLSRAVPFKFPAAGWVVTIGCILTIPGVPGADIINAYVAKVNFVALCTQILAYAGIAIGKDLDVFAKTGWRMIILSCVIFIGTYIFSAIIAQGILKMLGQI